MLSVSEQMRADQCSVLQINEVNVKVTALSLRTVRSTHTHTAHTHTHTKPEPKDKVVKCFNLTNYFHKYFPFFIIKHTIESEQRIPLFTKYQHIQGRDKAEIYNRKMMS